MEILTAKAVNEVLNDCLYKLNESTDDNKSIKGVINTFDFNPNRLEINKTKIAKLLAELPDNFHINSGGGWSFLNACMTKDGVQWGEHTDIECLVVLGIATGQAKYLMPRDMWSILPGGMPYFSVDIKRD